MKQNENEARELRFFLDKIEQYPTKHANPQGGTGPNTHQTNPFSLVTDNSNENDPSRKPGRIYP